MRQPRGDAAALLTIVALAACSPAVDALAPLPGSVAPVPLQPASQVIVSPDGDDRFYVPALDSVRRLRVRARDAAGSPRAGVSIAFEQADDLGFASIGVTVTDSTGLAAVPAFATGPNTGRRSLRATVEGASAGSSFSYLVLPAAYGGPSFRRCPIPPQLLPRYAALGGTLAALDSGDSLRVVAIGSSSTEGYLASSPAASYPSRLRERLAAAFPGRAVTVVNRGRGGQSALQMVAAFEDDVFANRPQLVIWQTGTIEARNAVPVDEFAATVRGGIATLRARGIDVLLMDSQAYPTQPADYERYQEALARISAETGVPLVTRYQLMRAYLSSGRYTFADLLAGDAFHPNDLTYDCMAHWVLAGILAAQIGA